MRGPLFLLPGIGGRRRGAGELRGAGEGQGFCGGKEAIAAGAGFSKLSLLWFSTLL